MKEIKAGLIRSDVSIEMDAVDVKDVLWINQKRKNRERWRVEACMLQREQSGDDDKEERMKREPARLRRVGESRHEEAERMKKDEVRKGRKKGGR